MKLNELIAQLNELARDHHDAEVLVDGWPIVFVEALPSYYDGPSKRFESETNTLRFIRSGTKVRLVRFDLEDFADMNPGLKLDTSELPEWQAERYREQLRVVLTPSD